MKTGRISRTARPEIPSPAFASPLPAIGPETGQLAGRGVVRPVERAVARVEEVDPGAVGREEGSRLVDRELEDLRRVAQRP